MGELQLWLFLSHLRGGTLALSVGVALGAFAFRIPLKSPAGTLSSEPNVTLRALCFPAARPDVAPLTNRILPEDYFACVPPDNLLGHRGGLQVGRVTAQGVCAAQSFHVVNGEPFRNGTFAERVSNAVRAKTPAADDPDTIEILRTRRGPLPRPAFGRPPTIYVGPEEINLLSRKRRKW